MFWVWLPSILWLTVIAIESTKSLSAANTALWLRWLIEHVYGHISWHSLDRLNFWARKTGHFCGYGILSVLFFHSWRGTRWLYADYQKLKLRWQAAWMWIALLGTLIVASLDEWHQGFIPSRTGTPKDVALDMVGAFVFQAMMAVYFTIIADLVKRPATTP